MDQVGLGVAERERAGERGQRPAALGIRHGAKIVRHQPDLIVPSVLEGEAVEEGGEAVHGASSAPSPWPPPGREAPSFSSSPYPTRRSGRAARPRVRHQWTRASSSPWVTQTSWAPLATIVVVRPAQ